MFHVLKNIQEKKHVEEERERQNYKSIDPRNSTDPKKNKYKRKPHRGKSYINS